MNQADAGTLNGVRVLIVEDEHLVALALADDLEEVGAIVVGTAATIEQALDLIEACEVEAAVLDIKLRGELVFPLAEELAGRGVPFVFTTGFDTGIVPDEFAAVPRCEKPASPGMVMALLAGLTRPGPT